MARALRVYTKGDVRMIEKVGCPQPAVPIKKLTAFYPAVLQGSCGVENTPPPKRVAFDRCHDDRKPVRDGVRLDEEWECP